MQRALFLAITDITDESEFKKVCLMGRSRYA
jgi:hypothetical protein